MLFIVSDVALTVGTLDGRRRASRVEVEKAPGVKCERCWRYRPVGPDASRTGRASATAASTRWPSRSTADRDSRPGHARHLDRRSSSSSLDQAAKALVRRRRSRCTRASTVIPGVLRPDARAQHRRGVRHAERCRLSVQDGGAGAGRRRARSSALALYAATLPADQRLARLGPGAHPRRRGRQPDRPASIRATWSTSSTSTGAAGTSGRSTSRTRPLRSASR